MEHGSNGNNHNSHPSPPGLNLGPDLFALASLKGFENKDILLQNIGFLHGIRVNNNNGPQEIALQAAKYIENGLPMVQELNDFLTESVTTKTERKSNYIHQGWSLDAASTISPWISSHIAAKNQHSSQEVWVTRRTLVQRLRVLVLLENIAPAPEFEAEIEAALRKPTNYQKFEAVYQALHKWGNVVPLEIEMGTSLVFTDLESNMS